MLSTGKNIKDMYKDTIDMQILMHKYGLECFKDMLKSAVENAQNDTEDLECKSIAESYQQFLYELNYKDQK